MATELVGARRRWAMLSISLGANLSSFVFINGVAFLIPALQS
jgi:hypothetical protein